MSQKFLNPYSNKMQNYIDAIRTFLENDIDVKVYTKNIHFLRVPKTKASRPLIVFTEMEQNNPYSEWNMREKGWDVYPVLFECIVDFSLDAENNAIKGREMRELLKAKLNWFKGVLNTKFTGQIYRLKDLGLWYDEKNDVVKWSSVYLFKAMK